MLRTLTSQIAKSILVKYWVTFWQASSAKINVSNWQRALSIKSYEKHICIITAHSQLCPRGENQFELAGLTLNF